jgi:hypothetical protein
MAIIWFKDGKRKIVSNEVGSKLWLCMHGYVEPDERQKAYIATVRSVHLDWRSAPDPYIRQNLPDIVDMVIQQWTADSSGRPVKPNSHEDYRFAVKWGLWVNNHPSALVSEPRTQMQLV